MPKENTPPKDYVSIRVDVVHVKKKWYGFQDKVIGYQICVPSTWEEADEIMGKIKNLFSKYGTSIGEK
jgi:hypothetical protein